MVAVGYSIEKAAALAGISRTTIARWAARGRAPDAAIEHATFAQRLDALRSGQPEDVDCSAGNAEELPTTHPYRWALEGDPFVVMSPEELAMLTAKQRKHVIALAAARRGDP